MTVGEKIQEVMDWRGKSQEVLGRLCGISQSAISEYINDKHSPPIDKLKKIADALDVSLWTFLNEEALPVTTLDITTQEAELIAEYRRLDGEEQKALNQFLKSIKR